MEEVHEELHISDGIGQEFNRSNLIPGKQVMVELNLSWLTFKLYEIKL